LKEIKEKRIEFLTQYQNAIYAERYNLLVRKAEDAEQNLTPGFEGFALAVARYAFKLMSYKDEYEVARLYTDGTFLGQLNEQFEGDFKIEFNLAPPLISKRDFATGHLKKQIYGPWLIHGFRALAKLKGLRGTIWDIFGKTAERKQERLLIEDYFSLMETVFSKLTRDNHGAAVELASIPEKIRGYGHVKEKAIIEAKSQERQVRAIFDNPELTKTAAE
jgi:indolepyruvate ferredoxin oxidoreductase